MADELQAPPPPEDSPEAQAADLRPLRLADLFDLYSRPRRFFTSGIDLGALAALLPVAWIVGAVNASGRLDTAIARYEMGVQRSSWQLIEAIVSGPWVYYWAWILGFGILAALISYWLGGWWYRMRMYMSGSERDIDKAVPRQLYIYSELVAALPALIITMIYTASFASYMEAYRSDEMYSLVLLIFPFWSIAVSYVGVTARFSLKPWPARFWFIIFPVLFYLVVLGAIIAIYAFLIDTI